MGRYEDCLYFDSLYNAVDGCFSEVGYDNSRTILRELILAPSDYVVEFNDSTYNKQQMAEMVAQELIAQCVEGTPQETFNTTIEKVADIIKHMNDGYITHADYAERNNFLSKAAHDEFLLFTAYAFRQTIQDADERKLQELKLNIIRYREFQDLITEYTRDEEEVETNRDDFEMARPIYKMLKSLQTLGYDYNFSPKERAGLGIDHEDDDDLTDDFNYDNWLKRIMLLQLRNELKQPEHEAKATDHVNYQAEKAEYTDINDRISQLRGIYSKRGFDSSRFNMLKDKNNISETDPEDNN